MQNDATRVANYLGTLDANALRQFCDINNIDITQVQPAPLNTVEEIEECVAFLISVGVTPAFVTQNKEVWTRYLLLVSEERCRPSIIMLAEYGSKADMLLYFRACYRFGFPAMSDADFDGIESLMLNLYPELQPLKEQTYDDDKYGVLVQEAIRLSGVKNEGKRANVSRMNLTGDSTFKELNSEKSKSIRPTVTVAEAFEFWKNAPMCPVHFSLKIDGVNTKAMFSKEEGLKLALSRGRAADSIDYTKTIEASLTHAGVDMHAIEGKVTGESFVSLKDLATVQSHYPDKEYKTPKSTAMAMLRAPDNFYPDDLKYLKFYAFDLNDHRPDRTFKELEDAGFSTPPALTFDGECIPRDSIEDFNNWLTENVMDPLSKASEELGIGSDGVVMYLLAEINTERKDKYSDSNIALKFGYWGAVTYKSKVTNIIFEQKRVEASIVLEIEPVIMRDYNTATRVGIGSPDILMRDGVKVGDTIEFERKSEAYNVYLRKV